MEFKKFLELMATKDENQGTKGHEKDLTSISKLEKGLGRDSTFSIDGSRPSSRAVIINNPLRIA